jgi:hypothetical protein
MPGTLSVLAALLERGRRQQCLLAPRRRRPPEIARRQCQLSALVLLLGPGSPASVQNQAAGALWILWNIAARSGDSLKERVAAVPGALPALAALLACRSRQHWRLRLKSTAAGSAQLRRRVAGKPNTNDVLRNDCELCVAC